MSSQPFISLELREELTALAETIDLSTRIIVSICKDGRTVGAYGMLRTVAEGRNEEWFDKRTAFLNEDPEEAKAEIANSILYSAIKIMSSPVPPSKDDPAPTILTLEGILFHQLETQSKMQPDFLVVDIDRSVVFVLLHVPKEAIN